MKKIKDLLSLLGIDLGKGAQNGESTLVNEVAEVSEIDDAIMDAYGAGNAERAYQLCMKAANKYRGHKEDYTHTYRERAIWMLEECAKRIKEGRRGA